MFLPITTCLYDPAYSWIMLYRTFLLLVWICGNPLWQILESISLTSARFYCIKGFWLACNFKEVNILDHHIPQSFLVVPHFVGVKTFLKHNLASCFVTKFSWMKTLRHDFHYLELFSTLGGYYGGSIPPRVSKFHNYLFEMQLSPVSNYPSIHYCKILNKVCHFFENIWKTTAAWI